MRTVLRNLKSAIDAKSNPTIAKQQEKYMKHKVKCMGLKAPIIKQIFKNIWQSDIKSMELSNQILLSIECYKFEYMEYKSFGCNILEKINKNLDDNFLNNIAIEILSNYCNTWATCDGLSSKVIRHMISNDKTNKYALIIKEWKNSDCIWIQRCSCVSFVCLARHGNYNNIIIEICTQCIKNNERFVQLGVGWVLRELSLNDLNLVIKFIKKYYNYFSREALRYAIEKMDNNLKQTLLKYNTTNDKISVKKSNKRVLNASMDDCKPKKEKTTDKMIFVMILRHSQSKDLINKIYEYIDNSKINICVIHCLDLVDVKIFTLIAHLSDPYKKKK
eukprot:299143_1